MGRTKQIRVPVEILSDLDTIATEVSERLLLPIDRAEILEHIVRLFRPAHIIAALVNHLTSGDEAQVTQAVSPLLTQPVSGVVHADTEADDETSNGEYENGRKPAAEAACVTLCHPVSAELVQGDTGCVSAPGAIPSAEEVTQPVSPSKSSGHKEMRDGTNGASRARAPSSYLSVCYSQEQERDQEQQGDQSTPVGTRPALTSGDIFEGEVVSEPGGLPTEPATVDGIIDHYNPMAARIGWRPCPLMLPGGGFRDHLLDQIARYPNLDMWTAALEAIEAMTPEAREALKCSSLQALVKPRQGKLPKLWAAFEGDYDGWYQPTPEPLPEPKRRNRLDVPDPDDWRYWATHGDCLDPRIERDMGLREEAKAEQPGDATDVSPGVEGPDGPVVGREEGRRKIASLLQKISNGGVS